MHYQVAPYEEAKLVSCIKGAIYDVIIDLRPDSPTYRQWISVSWACDSKQSCMQRNRFSAQAHGSQLTPVQLTIQLELQLTAHYRMFYIPEGFAHGFLTLSDNTEVFYQMSEFYMPEYARGIRWNDPYLRSHGRWMWLSFLKRIKQYLISFYET